MTYVPKRGDVFKLSIESIDYYPGVYVGYIYSLITLLLKKDDLLLFLHASGQRPYDCFLHLRTLSIVYLHTNWRCDYKAWHQNFKLCRTP